MTYKKINISLGWLAFLIATIVYFLTVEETASLWDCGEYITAAYKLEVGHPPGAPFFMVVGRVFSLFAGDVGDVALWINRMSALCSSFSILFLFWTITLLGKKIALKDKDTIDTGQQVAIFGSAFIGAMAYTFTESFWFSAVEGEVYAMSSLFTAVIFWAALKWDEEMTLIGKGLVDPAIRPLRWMVLIMFLFGLAIGVHLLGLLVLPAIAYIIMYNYHEGKKVSTKMFFITGIVGIFILGFIQEGIIPGTIALASKMEIFFVNSLGLPFTSGAIFFFILLISLLVLALLYTRKKGMKIANTAILGFIMLFIGYGSFATIVIRSNANPPLDENNPENLVTLHAFLKREQYGSWPLLYGEYYNSKTVDGSEYGDRSPFFDKRHVVTTPKGTEIAAFRDLEVAKNYVKNSGKDYDIVHKYFETNKNTRKNQVVDFSQKTIFPRMFFRGDANRTRGYKEWSGYDQTRRVSRDKIGEDNRPLPTFGNNITFFVNYQVNWMYWRYFMWNFAGRQNDIQGHGDAMRGNWISGFDVVDEARLGAQRENAPYFTSHNQSNNRFYFIPLILGLIGLFFHALKAPRDAFVVGLLFLFTGLAIVVYLNQKPFEPRERDYAFAASFYAFAIWVGLGVYGLYEAYRSFTRTEYKKLGIVYGSILLLCLISDAVSSTGGATFAIAIIGAIGGGAMLLMTGLRNIKMQGTPVASLAIILGLTAPIILGIQGWDDHDRSNRTPARALAWNYLQSVAPNGILYTNGDNDTFPLWYLQEVEGIRTDVRVANLSLMQTDWYTEQMTMRAYESDPLPIKFREDQILMGAGNTDYVLFLDYDIYSQQMNNPEKADEVLRAKIKHNKTEFARSLRQFRRGLAGAVNSMKAKDARVAEILPKIVAELSQDIEDPGYEDYKRTDRIMRKVFGDINAQKLEGSRDLLDQLQEAATSWMDNWDYLPIDTAMEFVRDDANMLSQPGGRTLRFFPSKGFILPVNAENAAAAGIIDEKDIANCEKELRFSFASGNTRGLSREEVMMLDILANFEWKRGISFSSQQGSEVSTVLYRQGKLQNLGQIHTLSPLSQGRINSDAKDRMYTNIIEKYRYGNLAADGVLVDYYVRRHTNQYRSSFLDLAMKYGRDYQDGMRDSMQPEGDLDSLVGEPLNNSGKEKAQAAADKIEEVLRYSMEVLPIDKVFDMGEPRPVRKQLVNGRQIYMDGIIPDYLAILYQVDKIELANEIASEYIDQLETLIDYFEFSDPLFAYNNDTDFIAFCMNFLRTYREVFVANSDNELGERVEVLYNRLNEQTVPKIIEGLRDKETSDVRNNKSITRSMEQEAQEFLELYQALLVENRLMEEMEGDQN